MASTDATPIPIKNQAFRATFPLFDNDGDLVTGAAGLDSEISKDAGTFTDCTNEATEIASNSGMYYLDLTATEMNADTVVIIVKTSTTDAKTTPIVLYPQADGLDRDVNITHWNGTAVASPDTAGYPVVTVKDGTGAGEIALTAGSVDNVGTVATLTGHTAQTGDSFARLGAPAGASISADIATVDTVADGIQTDLSNGTDGLGAIKGAVDGLNDLSAADVNAEVDTALADYDPPTKSELDNAQTSIELSVASLNNITALDVYNQFTSGSNEDAFKADVSGLATAASISALNDPTAAAIADAVWDESTTGHTTVGTFGEQVKTDIDAILTDTSDLQSNQGDWATATGFSTHNAAAVYTEFTNGSNEDAFKADVSGLATAASISALNDLSAADVNAEVDTALSDIHLDHLLAVAYDATSKPGAADALLNEMVEDDSGVTRFTVNSLENGPSGSGASAAAIADAVWDEALGDHTTAGSAGAKLETASTSSSLTVGDIADAVWDEATSGHTTSGTFGEQVKTDIDAILLDTNELQTDWANGGRLDDILDARASQSSVDTVDGIVDDILTDTGTTIPASISALNDLSTSDVDARLAAYDPPTRAELTTDINSVLTRLGTPVGADISADISTIDGNVDSILVDTGTTIPAQITALNDLSTADIDARLAAYDPPTRAELTSDIASVLSAVSGLNDPTATAIADAILSRSVTNTEDTASTDSLTELILAALHSSQTSTVLTIKKTDDTATFNTRTLVTSTTKPGVTSVSD